MPIAATTSLTTWISRFRFGLTVGLILAFIVARMGAAAEQSYYWEIMLPGGVLGLIVGYATQRYGVGRRSAV